MTTTNTALLETLRVSADVLRQAQGSLSHASGCPRSRSTVADCQCIKAVLEQTEEEARAAIAKAEGA